ncbi:acyl-CoA dehydrogenase family protein [Cognatishimia sp. F0-27]|uniref:acyl-CoA dehydrogenase family protein n=1 Tax=Cognatishimia sp. F0-27 TaxID=2816855 RepID=UPI001D0C1436|nr:acyl-CoA dehydrogenase family protein [Cognatishimia sp. F0-27]MCC1493202.1 acyl-CoA dehydrogenase family protein [Cognatishimia sp. F0-27]
MTPFKAPVEDILFSLVPVAGADLTKGWDSATAADILGHFGAFAEGLIAPLNATGDAQGARLKNGRVRMPDGFRDAYKRLTDDGWQGLTVPEAYGGMGLSPLIAAGVSEIFSGANHAMQMVCNLVPGAVTTLLRFGTDAQKALWIPKLASGEALSTMALTEPQAGSDLSVIRTKAAREGDIWKLDGEKIFISGGDQDMSEDILHMVLARSGDDGLRGLSLFLCAKQPGAKVTRIEQKLGLHASPTCHMVFEGAEAELIGEEGQGLKAMFTVMNHARLDVALQGIAHATQAARIARAYAENRQQGRGADGAPAVLSDHADVTRMLDEQTILAIGARAMVHLTFVELERGNTPARAEFLTSMCKVFGSEAGTRAADLGMQVMGGYGYLTEYGMEQIWRDARICAIYEGTNGIHAKGLATRGLKPGGGADAFEDFVIRISGEAPDQTVLATWQRMKQELQMSYNPSTCARGFYETSAALFQDAVWRRIRAVADLHADAARIKALAGRVLGAS